jgi:hypothetical protein
MGKRIAAILIGHLARLGGIIISPRTTLDRLLRAREGTVTEVLPWMVIVTMVVSPVEAGRAMLLLRALSFDGVTAFVMLVADRMAAAVGGVLGAAIVLHVIERVRLPRDEWLGFDRALDVAGVLLAPYFLLAIGGALLSMAGLELWWMPHRRLIGGPLAMVIRVAAGFGWSLSLFVCLVVRVLRPSDRRSPASASRAPPT